MVRAGRTTILVDCGFSRKELEVRLNKRGLSITNLAGVLITHEHSDHWRGAQQLAKRDNLSIHASPGTANALRRRSHGDEFLTRKLQEFDPKRPFKLGDLAIHPIVVPHDANEPTQFVLKFKRSSLGILTDCGTTTEAMVTHYGDVDALLLETNHDLNMLYEGNYPPELKRRVGGRYGHLNNGQSREFFDLIAQPKLKQLVLGHISLNNNSTDHVLSSFEQMPKHVDVIVATQDAGTQWISVAGAD